MAKASRSITKTAIWVLMGLLILGLGGFGAVNFSGTLRSIGSVGDKTLSVDQYARDLSQQIRAIERQTGETLTFARAQEIGLDRAVLQRLVRNRALDNEADRMGLSIGDAAVRDELLQIEAFQGLDGNFDREGYRYALRNSGMTEAEFETSLREEASRTLLQAAILGGVRMPRAYASTLVDFAGETRDFTWTRMTASALDTPVEAPDDAALQAYYDANPDLFTLPPTKRITYAVLTPDALRDEVEVPEEQLREAYEDRIDQYRQPERRLVERLVFSDQEAADQAAAALEVEGTTFQALVEERGLSLSDVDMGDVGRLELDAAGEAVFAAAVGDVVGPVPTDLGPALFRVNGVLPAQDTSFEDAREALADELAVAGAVRAVEARARGLDDQLAGGATLEQLAEETRMELGQIDWTPETSEGVAAYANFREAAAALQEDDFPKVQQLDDGGIFAMRLDESLPERPEPFDAARDAVRARVLEGRREEALVARAETLTPQLTDAAAFSEAGLDATVEVDQTRNGFVQNAPADLIDTVFAMAPGEVRTLRDGGTLVIVRLDAVNAAGENEENVALLDQLSGQLDQTLAQDLFNVYADAILAETPARIDRQAVQAVHVNFP